MAQQQRQDGTRLSPRSAPLLPGLGLHTLLLVHVYRSVICRCMQSTKSFKAPPRAGEASDGARPARRGSAQLRRDSVDDDYNKHDLLVKVTIAWMPCMTRQMLRSDLHQTYFLPILRPQSRTKAIKNAFFMFLWTRPCTLVPPRAASGKRSAVDSHPSRAADRYRTMEGTGARRRRW